MHVLYDLVEMMPNGEAAYFATHLDEREFPHIRVARDFVPQSDEPDLEGATLRELISLAHERGHEASWRAGTYVENNMAEEHRAWKHAEQILRELGFEDWSSFEEAMRVSIAEHMRPGTPQG